MCRSERKGILLFECRISKTSEEGTRHFTFTVARPARLLAQDQRLNSKDGISSIACSYLVLPMYATLSSYAWANVRTMTSLSEQWPSTVNHQVLARCTDRNTALFKFQQLKHLATREGDLPECFDYHASCIYVVCIPYTYFTSNSLSLLKTPTD